MRGVVSLAAALALPLTGQNGAPFPRARLDPLPDFHRDSGDAGGQGLSLPSLICWLGIRR